MAPGSLCERGAGLRRRKWLDRAPPLSLRSAVSGAVLRPRGGWGPGSRQQRAIGLRAQASGQDVYATAQSLTGRALAHGHEERARTPLAPHLWCRVVPLRILSGPPHLSILHWPRHLHPSRNSKHPLLVETWGGPCRRRRVKGTLLELEKCTNALLGPQATCPGAAYPSWPHQAKGQATALFTVH